MLSRFELSKKSVVLWKNDFNLIGYSCRVFKFGLTSLFVCVQMCAFKSSLWTKKKKKQKKHLNKTMQHFKSNQIFFSLLLSPFFCLLPDRLNVSRWIYSLACTINQKYKKNYAFSSSTPSSKWRVVLKLSKSCFIFL